MKRYATVALLCAAIATGCQTEPKQSVAEPVPVRHLQADGTDLAYIEQGSGTTVLFIHGASGDWRTWEALRPYFAGKYRFVSVSRRYHVPNAWADDGSAYSLDQHAADMAAFIRAMNVGKVHVVGSSYGGRLAGMLALQHPELLRSAVLGEPGLMEAGSAQSKEASAAAGKDFGKAAAAAKAGDDRQAAILLANAVADPDGFDRMSPPRQQRWLDNAKTVTVMFNGPRTPPERCDRLKGLTVPVLAVRGEKTRANFRYGHEELIACLPATADSAIIPGGTHFWAVDNSPAAAAAILAFIDKH